MPTYSTIFIHLTQSGRNGLKHSLFLFIVIFSLVIPAICFTDEIGDIVIFEGNAPIAIDGVLSDWDAFNKDAVSLQCDFIEGVENENDLSAEMYCMADERYLYVAVNVTDDVLVFGEEILDIGHDDCVCINFDYTVDKFYPSFSFSGLFSPHRQSLKLTADSEGNIRPAYYYYWHEHLFLCEPLGIQSALKQNDTGYTVECAIPRRLFDITKESKQYKMYIEIRDDDDGEDYDGDLMSTVINLESLHTSGGSARIKTNDVLYSILQDISNYHWSEAEEKLNSLDDAPWVKAMLAWVQLREKKVYASTRILSNIIERSGDEYIRSKLKHFIGETYQRSTRDYPAAGMIFRELLSNPNWAIYGTALRNLVEIEIQICMKLNYKSTDENVNFAYDIFEKEIRNRPLNPLLLVSFPRLSWFENVVNTEIFETALSELKNKSTTRYRRYAQFRLQLETARIYLRQGNRSEALEIIREIFDQNSDNLDRQYFLVDLFEQAGDYDIAIELYEKMKCSIIDTTKTSKRRLAKARLGIIRNYYLKGDYERATLLARELHDASVQQETQSILLLIQRKLFLLKTAYFLIIAALVFPVLCYLLHKYRNSKNRTSG